MSIGAGIIWSTLIALLAIAVWRTSVNKKWKSVGKGLAVVGLSGAAIGVGIWGWSKYQDRPQIVTNLAGVSLGATAVDVTLALGKPSYRLAAADKQNEIARAYLYEHNYDDGYLLFIGLDRQKDPRVIQICEGQGSNRLLGFGHYSSEQEIVAKLGQPSATSVHKDGFRKMISFPEWKAGYEIEKGIVVRVCISQDGVLEYEDELTVKNVFDRFDLETAEPVVRPPAEAWKHDPIVEEP